MHTALQRLPLGPLDRAGAAAFIQSLHARRLIGEAEAAALDPEALSWFSQTPLYERLCASRRAERELSFTYALAAAALYDTAAEERVLLQGVIDACYLEEDGWVLIDYKTDAPRPGDSEEALKDRHSQQIHLYAAALAALTKQPVKQCYVVYLSHRKCIAC
jgi:ATP-dependent helicase/nuclease subunit A